jgi:putative methyltransferase (TIGR04325 family)
MSALKRLLKRVLPPIAADWALALRDRLGKAPLEYLSAWPEEARGWNIESIAALHERNWPGYVGALRDIVPLGIGHALPAGRHADPWDIINHNNIVSFAGVLGLAAQGKRELSFLDWGGGVGHYGALAQTLMPELQLDYHCQDMPVFCAVGRRNLPQAHFWSEPDACFHRRYDLVFAGSSLWYARDWRSTLAKLSGATGRYCFVSRMIFVVNAPSFPAIQRPDADHGYATEYPMWILNRSEFLAAARDAGLEPVREFLIGHGPRIHRAPEEGTFRGFLFRPVSRS